MECYSHEPPNGNTSTWTRNLRVNHYLRATLRFLGVDFAVQVLFTLYVAGGPQVFGGHAEVMLAKALFLLGKPLHTNRSRQKSLILVFQNANIACEHMPYTYVLERMPNYYYCSIN